ncbi:type II toxin-antitoxin system Phd/YefM family antitoxin [Rhizobium sp. BK602]|uniref:type II toxin-antitoxin system Phd/YefM family antitoxin n=1 Tax=Rhizobium sp. BK602 TaxID=2586986 RepID=UPI001607351B|nr:type II toxin-antitoxin system Phd/YefM family antitoxin [Rhizobium sp. BK602]MBB3611733.1 prevent-host-death family protein [Rhizobium sp. BK602]
MSKQDRQLPTTKKAGPHQGGRWNLETAKARFSEVVRHARDDGPQRVSVRGREAVVIMSVEDYDRLVPAKPRLPLVEFMESLSLSALDVERESDTGRDVEL